MVTIQTIPSNIEFESMKDIESWLKEIWDQNTDAITKPGIPYSMYELQRELTRREAINDVKIRQWLREHKIQPCPLCGKEFSKQGRGMAYHSAKKHVLACKGE